MYSLYRKTGTWSKINDVVAWCQLYTSKRQIQCAVDNKLLTSVTIHWQKGKAIPLQAWTDPEGSRKLRLPDFKTIGTWRW
jgi:hypothetical protein